MFIAKLSYRRAARILALSIIIAGGVIGSSSLVAPTLSCPGPPPQPLRELYARSEKIVVARVGKSEIVKVEKNSDDESDSETTYVKTALLVSSTLKGAHEPVVYVDHYSYGDYKDALSSAADGDDTLLLFLVKIPGMDGYDVDMNYGLKKLSDADLKIYESRIEELGSMTKSGTPGDSEIVEWLVRCAEEPATRWEGAFELAMSKYMSQPQDAEADESVPLEPSEQTADEQAVEASTEELSVNETEFQDFRFTELAPVKANFLDLLTTQQKYRLTTALTNGQVLDDRDYYLIEVVQAWDDPRLVPYLLTQLDMMSRPGKSDQMSNYFSESLMTIVADKLDDDTLKALVKNINENIYNQAATYDDEQEPSDGNQAVAESNPEQEAAKEAETIQRRNAEVQYFVSLASSTVPKSPTTKPVVPVISAEP